MRRLAFGAVLVVALSSSARALVLCTTPDGKTYAGDKPPPGCEVKGDYPNSPDEAPVASIAPPSDTAFEAEAISMRRRIEDEINRQADSLSSARSGIAQMDRSMPDSWTWTQAEINNWYANRRILLTKESEARIAIARLRSEFYLLTTRVRQHNLGVLPSTWRTSLNCSGCP